MNPTLTSTTAPTYEYVNGNQSKNSGPLSKMMLPISTPKHARSRKCARSWSSQWTDLEEVVQMLQIHAAKLLRKLSRAYAFTMTPSDKLISGLSNDWKRLP